MKIIWPRCAGPSADGLAVAAPSSPIAFPGAPYVVDSLDRLKVAVQLLFELSRPEPVARRPRFTDFAPQLLLTHPAEVKVAHEPLLTLFTELMVDADAAGQLRPGAKPRRLAALTMQTVMFIAQSSGVPDDEDGAHPLTADEVWDFCARGFARR